MRNHQLWGYVYDVFFEQSLPPRKKSAAGSPAVQDDDSSVLDLVKSAASGIWETKGLEGFFVGGAERAIYYAPVACLFFTLYDTLVNLI